MRTQERNFPTSARIINGWIDADWNDDFINEDEHEDQQRDEHECEYQCEANNREGPMEVDGFDCGLDDVEDQGYAPESINNDISHVNEHTVDYSMHQPTPDPYTDAEWNGYKVVKDNFDKNIHPSFQRVNRQTLSTHYCHVYAVKID